MKSAAQERLPEAQFKLGILYLKGAGIEKEVLKGQNLLLQAAKQDHAEAQFELGHLYRTGTGVTRDGAEAIRWYKSAADLGYGQAMLSLGIMYDGGEVGTPKDPNIAISWYRQAAEKGIAQACSILGVKYFSGEDVISDPINGYVWALLAVQASEKGNNESFEQKTMYEHNRRTIFEHLNPEQITRAEQLAGQWAATHWQP